MSGKGSQYRPVDRDKFSENYSKIFGGSKKLLCACDGRACNGICKEKNLNRKRKDMDECPAVYRVEDRQC